MAGLSPCPTKYQPDQMLVVELPDESPKICTKAAPQHFMAGSLWAPYQWSWAQLVATFRAVTIVLKDV